MKTRWEDPPRWESLDLQCSQGMCMESIPVHFAWSCDLYRSAAVTFTVYHRLRFLFGAAGSGHGRQGVGTTLSHFVQAINPIVGAQNQALDWIGQTHLMV